MADDILMLGGIAFDQFSTPTLMGAGGRQAMVVHQLPGGQRVIDTLGPDEAPIAWSGFFFGNNAYDNALALDQMRAAGNVVPLIFGGQHRSVIVDQFSYRIRAMRSGKGLWVEYSISCVVYQNASQGVLGISSIGMASLVLADLTAALGL